MPRKPLTLKMCPRDHASVRSLPGNRPEQGHSLRRRTHSLPGRKNSLRRQKKFPAPTGEDICEVAFNALELQRELTPGSAGLAGNSKKSLPNSLHQGIHRPRRGSLAEQRSRLDDAVQLIVPIVNQPPQGHPPRRFVERGFGTFQPRYAPPYSSSISRASAAGTRFGDGLPSR
jgi:hypothetical protein